MATSVAANVIKLNNKYHGYIKLPGQKYEHHMDYIPTGSIAMDYMLGEKGVLCGIPRGVITTIYGREGAGKSTFVASCMKQAQKLGLVGFANTELRFDPDYFGAQGVDIDQLTVIDLNYSAKIYGEQIGEALIALAKTGDYSMLVCDSIAALTPKRTADSDPGESNPGLRARLIKDIIERIISPLKNNNVALMFTSQRSSNFGAVGFGSSKYAMVGGNSVKFYSSVLLKIDYIGRVLDKTETPIGIESRITLQKNIGISWGKVQFKITDGLGIDVCRELLDYGDVVYRHGKGSYYYYGDPKTGEELKLANGAANAVQKLRDNPELLEALIKKQREILGESNDEPVVES